MPRELTASLSPSNPLEEIVLEWRSPAGGDAITYYLLQWSHLNPEKDINHISGQIYYSETITNLNPATSYNVWICAMNSAGCGSYTAFKVITTGTKMLQWLCYCKLKKAISKKKFTDTVVLQEVEYCLKISCNNIMLLMLYSRVFID